MLLLRQTLRNTQKKTKALFNRGCDKIISRTFKSSLLIVVLKILWLDSVLKEVTRGSTESFSCQGKIFQYNSNLYY